MAEASRQKLTQDQLQELSVRFQQYQSQAEGISQQINMVQLTIKDLETALTTVEGLKDVTAGKETLVPIGFGSFVNATLTNTDKVVIGIGAGVSVEKNIDDAKATLEKRKVELTEYQAKLNETITKLTQELQNIQNIVQKHTQSQQPRQPRQPMRAE